MPFPGTSIITYLHKSSQNNINLVDQNTRLAKVNVPSFTRSYVIYLFFLLHYLSLGSGHTEKAN